MAGSPPIRVLIVDDHEMLRRGLKFFLDSFDDLHCVGEAADGREAIELCAEFRPDVILMDMMMPDRPGDEVTQEILSRWPEMNVVALSSFRDRELVMQALQAGTKGYLLKGISAEDLANAIREAYHGQATFSPEAMAALVEGAQKERGRDTYDLTPRESEVLELLAEGLTNAEIAEKLVVTVATVKFHVRGILTELGVSNRTEAVILALEEGLVRR